MTRTEEPDWRLMECPECGEVEEIDVAYDPSLTQYHCGGCGTVLELADGGLNVD